MTITYLVANYNQGEFIAACLDSLQSQTDSRWRCLVVDDASTDGSVEIVRSYLGRGVTVLRNESNQGYIPTLIRLIGAAETDLVAILDGDDALYPQATERLLQAFARNPQCGFVHSKFTLCNAALRPSGEDHGSAVPPGRSALFEGFVSHIKSFRRSAYERTEGLDPSILYAEDRDLVYKMEEVTPFYFIDEPLYYYRNRPHSQSSSQNEREQGFKNHLRARRHALSRRGIQGPDRLRFLSIFFSEYMLVSNRFSPQAKEHAQQFRARLFSEPIDWSRLLS